MRRPRRGGSACVVALVASEALATSCAAPRPAPDPAGLRGRADRPGGEVKPAGGSPSKRPPRAKAAEEIAARAGLPPGMVAPALLTTDPLPEGWQIEKTGLPVDPEGLPHSVGREFAPPILRGLPQCWVYPPKAGRVAVPVRFLRGSVHVKRGCVDDLFFYVATAKRPFEVKSGVSGGYACGEEDVDAEHVSDAVEAAHDIAEHGDRVVFLNERGEETLALVRPAEDCL